MNDLDEIYKPKVLTDAFVENETCGVVDNFSVDATDETRFCKPTLEEL